MKLSFVLALCLGLTSLARAGLTIPDSQPLKIPGGGSTITPVGPAQPTQYSGSFSGNGAGITNVNALTFSGHPASDFVLRGLVPMTTQESSNAFSPMLWLDARQATNQSGVTVTTFMGWTNANSAVVVSNDASLGYLYFNGATSLVSSNVLSATNYLTLIALVRQATNDPEVLFTFNGADYGGGHPGYIMGNTGKWNCVFASNGYQAPAPAFSDWQLLTFVYSNGLFVTRENGLWSYSASYATTNLGIGGRVELGAFGGTMNWRGGVAFVGIWTNTFAEDTLTRMERGFLKEFGLWPKPTVILLGDSIYGNTDSGVTAMDIPFFMSSYLGPNSFNFVNASVGGTSPADWLRPCVFDVDTNQDSYFCVSGPINLLQNGINAGAALNSVSNVCTFLHSNAPTSRIVVSTCPPCLTQFSIPLGQSFFTNLYSFNSNLRASYKGFADAVADVAAEPILASTNNLNALFYINDSGYFIHPNSNGCSIWARPATRAILGLRNQRTSGVY